MSKKGKDYYAILGVAKTADEDAIKKVLLINSSVSHFNKLMC
jgi:hypothetical protein